ncbi:GRAM domain-containing protein 2B-like isoform X2 [Notolabrus celidotus]|uniref:GRAM domain-containing protein 2B-like isoform X2 n=1 Tax=Notolabrus celidotus TaxID=1203425 RepID=UPI00148F4C90|nr:GRAM domain-containing protein 2B-like isoform X2 [Notolabrus celidotus]
MRKLSLDSSFSYAGPTDGAGLLGAKGGSSKLSRKYKSSLYLEDARMETQELNRSLSNSPSIREQPIAEENLERPDGLISSSSSFKKHNKNFRKLFPEIPQAEELTHAFTGALQKDGLYHGKIYISGHHVCFHSSMLLKETKVAISGCSVSEVKKYNSALSMLSIKTSDGEKYSFVSLRNRELCYNLIQNICSYAKCLKQEGSPNNSPHLSSAENEPEQDIMASGNSSLEDSVDHDLSRQNSITLESSFPHMSSDGERKTEEKTAPTRTHSTHHVSAADTDSQGQWIWMILERVAPFLFVRGMRNLSTLFYIYLTLMLLLLVASGYIGLRIIALEEQLNSLGTLTDLALRRRPYQET